MKIEGLRPVINAQGKLIDAEILVNGQAVSCKSLMNPVEHTCYIPLMGTVFATLQQRLAQKGYK